MMPASGRCRLLFLFLALCLPPVLAGCNAEEAADCYRAMPVAQGTPAVTPALADSITADMTMEKIFESLGPAARDVGSGLHILEWDVTDGRILSVSVTDMCAKPHSVASRKLA